MSCTAIKRIAAALLIAICTTAAAAPDSDKRPPFLTVPVLGLRLPLDHVNLELFPEDLRLKCPQLYDAEAYTSRVWIVGRASDAGKRYYVLTGYFERFNPAPGRKRFEYWNNGAVYTVTDTRCGGDDARETFDVHDENAAISGNVPIPILQALASDLAVRTVKAFGGPDKLRAALISQRIDYNALPPEFQQAFAAYFDR
jgi:hypothetical protein